MYRGQLIQWNDDKGFGFINCEELKSDTFIHISALKHMNRKPKQGDFIHFDIEQHNGKSRAVKARIEGVKTSTPFKSNKRNQLKLNKIFIYIVLVVILAAFIFQRANLTDKDINKTQLIPVKVKSIPAQKFTCDGRQHCSQMNSRAEAEYFNRYCPDTKMDGDADGVPCENDSRF